MTFRYNPQSIEKQVRKWPVLFSEKDLNADLELRLNQLLNLASKGWINPFSVSLPFEDELIYEYGIDACRLAIINKNSNSQPETLLEPSYKWLAKLYDSLNKNKSEYAFNPIPWLEAVIQFKDHILERKSPRLALSLVMKAFNEAPPSPSLQPREKELIYACLSPFVPIISTTLITKENILGPTINEIVSSFREYFCVRIALEKGGWHWQVFSRKIYEDNPISELSKIKWIHKAIVGKQTSLKEEDGGIRICFS